MIWILLVPLVALIFYWGIMGRNDDGFGRMPMIFMSVIMGVVFCMGIMISCDFDTKHWVESDRIPLASLRNADGMEGRMYLGSGTIGTGQYYFYYQKVGESYRPGKVSAAHNVLITEQKREGGDLVIFRGYSNISWWWWFGVENFGVGNLQKKKYEFFIPEGSLDQKFVLR